MLKHFVYFIFSVFMQDRKRKISHNAETKAATRLRVANLQQRIGSILNPSLLSNNSTDNIESEHEEDPVVIGIMWKSPALPRRRRVVAVI